MKQYRIFDVNAPIMEQSPVFMGKNSTDAVKKYLNSIGQSHLKIKASGSNFVRFSAQQVRIENDKTYILGGKKQVWFEVILK